MKYHQLHNRLGKLVNDGQIELVTNTIGDAKFETIEKIPFDLKMQLHREMMLFDALRVVSGEETEDMYWQNYGYDFLFDDAKEILESVQDMTKHKQESN